MGAGDLVGGDEGDDAAATLEFENMDDPIQFQITIWPNLMSLLKCIKKSGIAQLKSN